MLDVFLSYSQQDREIAGRIALALAERGYKVWWDVSLRPGESFADEILRRIDEAAKVVVLWSPRSIKSEWVLAEAHRARDANKLVPIFLPGIVAGEVPPPFNLIHSIVWNEQDGLQALQAALKFQATEIGKEDTVAENTPYTLRRDAKRVRVFIAHASSDKPRLSHPLAEIAQMGFKIWIDKPEELDVSPSIQKQIGTERIHYGQDWQSRISEAVKKADCVLAFWSRDAIRGRSQQFYYELYMGLVQQKLIQCRIDTVPIDEIGMPYTFHHIADLSKFSSGRFSLPLDQLMEDLAGRKRRWLF